ncbi:MAG: carboxypeptidase regulatory-like domain-containing protein, partial [Acidobacteriota bacterium]
IDDLDLEPVQLQTDSGLDLSLVAPDGAPLAATPLVVYRAARASRRASTVGFDLPVPLWHGAPELARTDDRGAVRLAAAIGETLWIQATPDGLPQLLERVEVTGAPGRLKAKPAPVGRLVIRDTRGRPVADAFAFADRQPLPIVRTDDRGAAPFAIQVGRPTRIDLVSADGGWGTYTLTAGEDRADGVAELVLQHPRRIRGQVRDHLSGRPLADALVWPISAAARAHRTDRSGGFEITVSAPEDRVVAAFGIHRPDIRFLDLADENDVPVITLRPRAACRADGRLFDPDGAGVAEAELIALPLSSVQPRPDRVWPWRSDAEGSVRLDRLACGEAYRVLARRPGFVTAEHELPPLDPRTPFEFELTLERGRQAVGRVVDQAEAPIVGATVRLLPNRPTQSLRFRMPTPAAEATTDAEGGFTLDDLPVGRFDLDVAAEGFASVTIPGLEIDAGPWTDLGIVALDRGASLVGRVVDDRDRPIANAEIHVLGAAHPRLWRMLHGPRNERPKHATDADGRFQIDGFTVDVPVTISARAEGHVPGRLDGVLPGDAPIRIRLARSSTLRGKVVDGSGWPVEGAEVSIRYPGRPDTNNAESTSDNTDNLGHFELANALAGSAEIHVQAREHQNRQLVVTVPEPGVDAEPLEIVLTDGARLDGVVLSADGEPVEQAWVLLHEPRGSVQEPATTDSTGRFRLRGLAPGRYDLQVTHENLGTFNQSQDIEEGEQFVELRYQPGIDLAGQVVDDTGLPVAGASIFAHASGNFPAEAKSDASGRFVLRSVSAGTYSVRVNAEGFASIHEEVEVGEGANPLLDLVLPRGAQVRGRVSGLSLDELSRVTVRAMGPNFVEGRIIDFEGGFEILGLMPGAYELIADLDNGGRQANAKIDVADASPIDNVTLEFLDGFAVHGTVLIDGRPTPGVSVSLMREGRRFQNRTVQNGTFRFSAVPSGEYEVLVFGNDGLLDRRTVTISADTELTLEPRGLTLEGRVVGPDGEPVSGTDIRLENADGQANELSRMVMRHVATDAAGRFRITAIQPGLWTVIAQGPGLATRHLALDLRSGAPPSPLEIRLDAAAGVRLRVLDADGRPVRQLYWSRLLDDGTTLPGRFDQVSREGLFELEALTPGAHRLIIAKQPGLGVSVLVDAPGDGGTVTLPPMGQLVLTDHPTPGEQLTLQLVRPDGVPASSMIGTGVQLADRFVWTSGNFEISVPTGVWTVRALFPDGRTVNQAVTVGRDEGTQVKLP